MKKLFIIFLITLLPVAQSFAGQASVNVTDLDYAFSSADVQVIKPLSASKMQATDGEILPVVAVIWMAGSFGIGVGIGFWASEAMEK